MLRALAGFTLLLTGVDHWTTYQCLRAPVAGWNVVEANPLENPETLRSPVGVMLRGRWIPAEELRAGLARIAERNRIQ